MKRLALTAALLSSALIFPVAAQEAGSAEEPIIKAPQSSGSGEAQQQKTDRVTEGSTEKMKPKADGSDSAQTQTDDAAKTESAQGTEPQTEDGGQGATAQTQDDAATDEQKAQGTTAQGGTDATQTQDDATAAGEQNNQQTQDTAEQAKPEEGEAGVSKETTASVNITTEQKTEIRNLVVEKADPIDVDFEVDVGVAVPRTVTLQTLPTRVIEIVPQYEGYKYFVLADGRIIIVDPDSLEIVYVLVV
jgi:hypothetical protein